jgi:hypothetical protein
LGFSIGVLTGGEGDDGGGGEGGVEGGGVRGVAVHELDEGGVASLDGEDRSGGKEEALVGDGSSGSEVGRRSDTLEDLGESEEARDTGVGEGVVASLDGGGSGGGEGGGEEGDVGGLVRRDGLEEGVEASVSGGNEVGGGELGEGLRVEGV